MWEWRWERACLSRIENRQPRHKCFGWRRLLGAGEGVRTLDHLLGKQELYH